jgi:hypothetical protein
MVECHYKDKFDGEDNLTGIEMGFSKEIPSNLVGIFLLGSPNFSIPGRLFKYKLKNVSHFLTKNLRKLRRK